MIIWLVMYLPNVGDEVFDSAWSTEDKAKARIAKAKYPGQWRHFLTEVDGDAE